MRYVPAKPAPSDGTIAQGFTRFMMRPPRPIPPSTSRSTDAGSRVGPPPEKGPRVNLQGDQAL